jgi:hypothetical protein
VTFTQSHLTFGQITKPQLTRSYESSPQTTRTHRLGTSHQVRDPDTRGAPAVLMDDDQMPVWTPVLRAEGNRQGLSLAHCSAQPKPFWSVSRCVSSL